VIRLEDLAAQSRVQSANLDRIRRNARARRGYPIRVAVRSSDRRADVTSAPQRQD